MTNNYAVRKNAEVLLTYLIADKGDLISSPLS